MNYGYSLPGQVGKVSKEIVLGPELKETLRGFISELISSTVYSFRQRPLSVIWNL